MNSDIFDQMEESVSVVDKSKTEVTEVEKETKKIDKKIEKKKVTKQELIQTSLESQTEDDSEFLEKLVSGFTKLEEIEYPYNHTKIMEVIFGDKGSGKTINAFAVPGNILALGYEAETNLTLPHEVFYSSTKRIQLKPFDRFIEETDGEIKKTSCNIVFEATLEVLRKAKKLKKKFDWIVFDGLERLTKICEMRMRLMHSFGAYEGFKELTIWNERIDYLNQLVRDSLAAVNYGLIFTSQNVFQEASFGAEKGKKKEPAWKGKVKDDTTTVIYTRKVEEEIGDGTKSNTFFAYVDSCKLSGFSGELEVTVKKDNNPKVLVEKILNSKPKYKVE